MYKKNHVFLLIGAIIFIIAMFIPENADILRFILFLCAFLASGLKVIISAFKGIVKGNIFNENTLMIIAAIGAFCIKEYPEAVFVVLFYSLGELFENYAVNKSRKSINEVMNICPEYANILIDGKIVKVDPDDVEIGDIIVVGAGERIPLDGIVIKGNSFIDTSALTGESVPRKVNENDTVLSGCINMQGSLTVKVTKDFEDSTVSRILELVETASARKSTSERFITKFAKYYTPAVLICAVLLAFLPPLFIKDAILSDYVYRALSFLVVSCPCALVISVPLAFFGGIGGAAKKGILIKGGNYLEMLSKVENIGFDKTGTLTKGVFAVEQINCIDISRDELLEMAAYAENVSSHPIAQTIRNTFGKEIETERLNASSEIPGLGVNAIVDGKNVLAGSFRLMENNNIRCKKVSGPTVVYIAINNEFKGSIIISDEIKNDAYGITSALKKAGIKKTFMLTGDIKASAVETAEKLGIDDVHYELLPVKKVEKLEEIMTFSKGKTAYAGDGINDAPVLARADVGIAMGALGSDAAIEAADIVIMTDELTKIETAVKLSKKTMRIAEQNIIFSVMIKIAILVLCSLNIVGMSVAVFGDVGVMILAVLNSFRALKK